MSNADESWLGPEPPAALSAQQQALAMELRRVLAASVEVRAGDLLHCVAAARALADALEILPTRAATGRAYDPDRFNPISGSSNAVAAPLTMWKVTEGPDGPDGRRTEGRVRFGSAYEGPPGHVHGGIITAMYDDLLGRSQLSAGFTGSITVKFRRPTPLHRDLDVRAWVARADGRKRWVHGTCQLDGVLLTEAEGLFISPREGASIEGIAASLAGGG